MVIELSRVAVVRNLEKPSDTRVNEMVKEALDKLGGIKSIVREGDTVALKPNVVTGTLSGPGVTTDKRVVEALIKLCEEAKAGKIMIVEGAGYFTETSKALELSGYTELAKEHGVEIVDVDKSPVVELDVPNALLIEKVEVSGAFMEADVRINVPVMKTHDQLKVTLGVKNLKGVLPKYMKRNFHKIGVVKGILDLNKAVPVDLTVLDAIVAMEGLGPSFGPKVELNTVIASKDVYALDRIASARIRPAALPPSRPWLPSVGMMWSRTLRNSRTRMKRLATEMKSSWSVRKRRTRAARVPITSSGGATASPGAKFRNSWIES